MAMNQRAPRVGSAVAVRDVMARPNHGSPGHEEKVETPGSSSSNSGWQGSDIEVALWLQSDTWMH